MKKLTLLLFVSLSCSAWAQSLPPRCWSADQPNAKLEDGIFRIHVPTGSADAVAVAMVMLAAQNSLAVVRGVAASDDLSDIEIDVYGDLQYWRKTQAFPTLNSFKEAILRSLRPVYEIDGVHVECLVPVPRHRSGKH